MEKAIQEIIAAAKEAKTIGWKTIFYQFKKGERETFEGDIIAELRNRTLGAIQCKKDSEDHIELILN